MVDNFPAFAKMVAADFQSIAKSAGVFSVDVEGDALYATYLAAFPEGTNPRFKERTEHDCSCCRQFIKRAGAVVSIDSSNSVLRTAWDHAAVKAPHPYNVVATAMREAVLSASINSLYRVAAKEGSFGAVRSHSLDKVTGKALTWDHFHTGDIPPNLRTASDKERGDYGTAVQVFERGLVELRPDAVDTVLSLIEANNLYRGEEHKGAVTQFQRAQSAFLRMETARSRNIFVWTNAHGPAARFRNTVIGTLVQDISEGQDVERAVKSFESKVAPQNYKRTSAVITPMMVKKAMETIAELGLESALERRFAAIGDISVNDVLWVDGAAKSLMKGGIGDMLMAHAEKSSPKKSEDEEKRAEEIGLSEFVSKILPEATGMEFLFKGAHLGNLVSLTAPVHPEPKHLFRWDNDFAWSYSGNVADSIAERVKKAGGKVEGATLRVSLSWFNLDDLDLHIKEPPGRGVHAAYAEIYYGHKCGWTGGELDVDMNVGTAVRDAVENIVWMKTIPNGAYKVVVNNYRQRETSNPGFVIEIENAGKLSHFSYNKVVRDQSDVHVATLHMSGGAIERVEMGDPSVTATNAAQDKWGLTTEQYAKVNAVTLSPNRWGESRVGNEHVFLFLDGCKSDEATRGIYNEFLHPRLEEHRKVFEVIGDKTKCQPTEGQLSGVGFSTTKRDSFLVRVQQGKRRRILNVKVG